MAQSPTLTLSESPSGEKGKSQELQREQLKELESEVMRETEEARRRDERELQSSQFERQIRPTRPQQKYGAEQQAQTLDQGGTNNARFLNPSNIPVVPATPSAPDADPANPFGSPTNPNIPSPFDSSPGNTPPPAPEKPSANQPADPFAPGTPVPDRGPVDPFAPPAIQDNTEGEGSRRGDGFGSVTRGGFKAEGRISLPINFPTQGEPIVFSKLKANASISIEAAEIGESSGRVGALLALVVGMAILFGIDRLRVLRKGAK